MRKFKGHISMSLVGCRLPFEFEVDDETTDEEVEQIAREVALELIDWNFDEVK